MACVSTSSQGLPLARTTQVDPVNDGCLVPLRAVFLVNFLAPNHLAVCEHLQRRLSEFAILVSVPMEANRDWNVDTRQLDVRVQRSKTWRRTVKHPSGFEDPQFIHVPLDTFARLRSFRPDVIVSHELGARSLLTSLYCRWAKMRGAHQPKHVISVYASERSEAGRGGLRRRLRRYLLKHADVVTYNGPSCLRYLLSICANASRLLPWDYAADPRKVYSGAIECYDSARDAGTSILRLLTVGQLVERKGVVEALRGLSEWASKHPDRELVWDLVGTGPLTDMLKQAPIPSNLSIRFLGHLSPIELVAQYREHALLLFPTLADEWGLVVDEALQSGLAVIGSRYSQAVETLIKPALTAGVSILRSRARSVRHSTHGVRWAHHNAWRCADRRG